MSSIYELYGRQTEELQTFLETWEKTLQMLRDMAAGNVLPSQLEISDTGWKVRPPVEED